MFLLGSFTQGLTNGGRFVSDLADAYSRRQYMGEHTRKLKLENDWTQRALDDWQNRPKDQQAGNNATATPVQQPAASTSEPYGPIAPTDLSNVPVPKYMQSLHTMGGANNPELPGRQPPTRPDLMGAPDGSGAVGTGGEYGPAIPAGGVRPAVMASPAASPVPVADAMSRPLWADVNQADPTAGNVGAAIKSALPSIPHPDWNKTAITNRPPGAAPAEPPAWSGPSLGVVSNNTAITNKPVGQNLKDALGIGKTAAPPVFAEAPTATHLAGNKPLREVDDSAPARVLSKDKRENPFENGKAKKRDRKEAKVIRNG